MHTWGSNSYSGSIWGGRSAYIIAAGLSHMEIPHTAGMYWCMHQSVHIFMQMCTLQSPPPCLSQPPARLATSARMAVVKGLQDEEPCMGESG